MKYIIAILFFSCILYAQDIAVQYFQNTDDIREAKDNNEITYEQYVELMQLFEEKIEVNTGNLRRLLSIPGVDRSDIEALEAARIDKGPFRNKAQVKRNYRGDFNLIEPFIVVVPPVKLHISGYAKVYTSRDYAAPSDNSDPYQKAKLQLRYKKFYYDMVIRQSGNGMGLLSSRSLKYSSRKAEIIVGNYYRKELGYGLMVGRYLSISSTYKDNDAAGYLLSPTYGDMNGLYARWNATKKWQFATAISGNWYDSSSQNLLSGAVSYYKRKIGKIGMVFFTGSVTDIEDNADYTYSQTGASVFGEIRFSGWKLRNETGLLTDGSWGTQYYLYSPRRGGGSMQWIFWAYHPHFRPFYSDGEADYGTKSYYPDSFEFYLKSKQAGEYGSAASVRFPLYKKIKGEMDFSFFNVANDPDNGAKSQVSVKYDGGRGKYVNIYADRRWDGWDANGDTKDKVSVSSKFRIFEKFTLQSYAYMNWTHYQEGNWRNGAKVSETVWFRPQKTLEFGFKAERNDGNLDDPEYGYWGISLTPHINIRNANWKTEFSFRKYDNEQDWKLQMRINALIGW